MNMTSILQELPGVARAFAIPGSYREGAPCGNGHIHATCRVVFDDGAEYIFQRLNNNVFKDLPRLMENMARVTAHVRARLEARDTPDIRRRVITLVPARDGGFLHKTGAGAFWRCYHYVGGVRELNVVETPADARVVARTWGGFLNELATFPSGVLHETIPDFHNTPKRLAALERAVARDACGRAREVAAELAFARERVAFASLATDALASGELPARVTHNDTKANNILIDAHSGEGICVIDLDTCMPGSLLYDFGDMVRTSVGAVEDEPDLSKVAFRFDLYQALAGGFLERVAAIMTPAELALLHLAGPLMTFECGMRFLTDYLEGDTYFRTSRPGHNLDRCRVQFHLVRGMEKRAEDMRQLTRALLKK